MKLRLFVLLFLAACSLPSFAQDKKKIDPKLQAKYLIPETSDLYIGAPESIVKTAAAGKKNNVGHYFKKFTKGNVKEITYQMTSEGSLYEFIIEYKPDFDLYSMMARKYGEPNDNEGWKFELADGLVLKIWQFRNKLCIIDNSQF